MRAVAVFPNSRKVETIVVPEPRITRPEEVMIRVLETGICGTDREICRFHYGTPPAGSDHLMIGHEMLGIVERVGEHVSMFKPGDLVVPMVRRPCARPDCVACRNGRQDFCYTGAFTERGIRQHHGFMTERVVEQETFLVPVPAELREAAVLVEPLTIAEKALIQIRDVQNRLPWTCPIKSRELGIGHECHRAVVLGAGPVGLLGAMALRAAGFRVWVYSRETPPSRKSSIVERIGATYVSASQNSVAELAEMVGNIDLVYEAVGASKLAFDVLEKLGTNGVFVFTGVPGRTSSVEVDTDTLMREMVLRNQVLFGTVNAGRDAFEAAIGDLQRFMRLWPDAMRDLFTSQISIDAAPASLLDGHSGIKDVVRF